MMCTFFSATTRDGKCEKITTDHVILDRKRTLCDWLNIDRTFIIYLSCCARLFWNEIFIVIIVECIKMLV